VEAQQPGQRNAEEPETGQGDAQPGTEVAGSAP
jgi:hypothetical protein